MTEVMFREDVRMKTIRTRTAGVSTSRQCHNNGHPPCATNSLGAVTAGAMTISLLSSPPPRQLLGHDEQQPGHNFTQRRKSRGAPLRPCFAKEKRR